MFFFDVHEYFTVVNYKELINSVVIVHPNTLRSYIYRVDEKPHKIWIEGNKLIFCTIIDFQCTSPEFSNIDVVVSYSTNNDFFSKLTYVGFCTSKVDLNRSGSVTKFLVSSSYRLTLTSSYLSLHKPIYGVVLRSHQNFNGYRKFVVSDLSLTRRWYRVSDFIRLWFIYIPLTFKSQSTLTETVNVRITGVY